MELPKRKPNRAKGFDYSEAGAYFVTICTEGRKNILSKIIVGEGLRALPYGSTSDAVGGGLRALPHGSTSDAVGEGLRALPYESTSDTVGEGLRALPYAELTEIGIETEKSIEYINKTYDTVEITKYVIMPNHIHMIVEILPLSAGGHGGENIYVLISPTKDYCSDKIVYDPCLWRCSVAAILP